MEKSLKYNYMVSKDMKKFGQTDVMPLFSPQLLPAEYDPHWLLGGEALHRLQQHGRKTDTFPLTITLIASFAGEKSCM